MTSTSTPARARRYYAARYPYGQRTLYQFQDGPRVMRTVYQFATRAERDQWVSNGPEFNSPGARESVTRAEIAPDLSRSARTSPSAAPFWADSYSSPGARALF